MKKNILYTLVGIQEGFSYKSSFLLKKVNTNFEISCPVNTVDHLYNLISKEDIRHVKEISHSLLLGNSKI